MKQPKWYLLLVTLIFGALMLVACGGSTEPTTEAEEAVDDAAAEVEEAVDDAEEAAEEAVDDAEEAVDEAVEDAEEAMDDAEADMEEEMDDAEEAVDEAEESGDDAMAETTTTLRIWADENRIPVLESLQGTIAEQIGVELVLEQVALDDMAEQVRIAIPAGEGPDIFIAPHDQIGSYIDGGLITPISLGAKEDGFVSSSLEAFTYNSELYGMPYASENVAFFRNADLVPEPVETWADVRTVCEDLIAAGTIETCTVFPNTNYHIYGLHTAFGGYIFGQDADGNFLPEEVGLDSEGFIASGDYIQSMVADGLVPATADGQTADSLFMEGEIPFVLNGPWALNDYRASGVNYVVDPIPAGDAGPGAPFLGVQGFVVNALSDNALLAETFLTELVATTDIMDAFQEQDPRIPAWQETLEGVDDEDLAGFAVISPYASPMPNIPQWAPFGALGVTRFSSS